MEIVADLDATCSPRELFGWVEDLALYPQWLEIVTRAEATGETDGEPAWAVDLRGRMGPLARSKRLRMVRTAHEAPHHVVFERAELDGRTHSAWVLRAEVLEGEPNAVGSTLRMTLTYDGSLFGPVLERVLRDEIERSRDRLLALVGS